jgi:hypothetical protein
VNPTFSDYDIQDVAEWRLGAAAKVPVADWRSNDLIFDESKKLASARAAGMVWGDDGLHCGLPPSRDAWDFSANQKLCNLQARLMKKFGSQLNGLSIFAAMQDARMSLSYGLAGFDGDIVVAQLSDARLTNGSLSGPNSQIVLWLGDNEYRPPAQVPDVPWEQRVGGIFWRGAISGSRFDFRGSGEPILDGFWQDSIFLTTWLKQLAAGAASDWEQHRHNYQRLIVLDRADGHPEVDVKLVDWAHGGGTSGIDFLKLTMGSDKVTDRLDRQSYFHSRSLKKFTLTLEGNDRPSSFREDLLSGSCLLLPKPKWESSAHYGLKAGEHYVELKADLSDLADKLQWCTENDAVTREIALAGQQHARKYLNPAFELKVQARMIELLKKATVLI